MVFKANNIKEVFEKYFKVPDQIVGIEFASVTFNLIPENF